MQSDYFYFHRIFFSGLLVSCGAETTPHPSTPLRVVVDTHDCDRIVVISGISRIIFFSGSVDASKTHRGRILLGRLLWCCEHNEKSNNWFRAPPCMAVCVRVKSRVEQCLLGRNGQRSPGGMAHTPGRNSKFLGLKGQGGHITWRLVRTQVRAVCVTRNKRRQCYVD